MSGALGLVLAATSSGQPLFGNPQWRSVLDASAVACADLDEDGTLDLVVANLSDQSVSVFLTESECELLQHASVSLGHNVDCVVVGDVDGQNGPDIITAHADDGKIGVLLNDGAGAFPDPATFFDAITPRRPALADLDHDPDGRLDIVAADRDGDLLQALYNDGFGGFDAASSTNAGTTHLGVASMDLDGDGWSDVAVCSPDSSNNEVVILLNDQAGGLSAFSSVSLDSNPKSVAIGDLDGDTDPDLAIACADDKVVIAVNSGSGTFTIWEQSPGVDEIGVTGSPAWIAAGDLDGDSDLDLATANRNSDLASILLNNGDATFTVALELNTNDEPTCVEIADMDNDADAEIVLAHALDGGTSMLLNDDDVWFRSFGLTGTTTQPVGPVLADVDLDGYLDAIVGSAFNQEFLVHPGNGTATFDPAITYSLDTTVRDIVAADLDDDLDVDLAMSLDSFEVVVFENDGSGNLSEAWRSDPLAHAPNEILAGLLDTDAYPDLAIAYNTRLGVFYNQGSCQFGTLEEFVVGEDHGTSDIALGDFDGDDDLDVLAAGTESGYYENDGAGGFASYTVIEVGDPAQPIEAHLAAVWQGYQPILTNRDTKVMRVVHYSGGGYYTDNYALGSDPTDVLCADLDAGAGQELLVSDAADGSVYAYRFRIDLVGFAGPTPYGVGPNPQGLATGDVNGDGYPDVVTQNGILDQIAANVQLPPKCPADLNVDGRTNVFDFAIFVQNFGAGPGATRQMGDFNNDGYVNIFDFAIFAINFGCSV